MNRLRTTTQYIITGTKFLRLASRKVLGIYGTNLQNIEKNSRKMYLPDEGYMFSQRDQAGAEALIVAYLCRHGNFRDLFLNGIKPHVFVALHLFREIWKQKMDSTALDVRCDIDELCNTSIPALRLNPHWKAVDKIIKSSDNWSISERYYYIAKQVCHSCLDSSSEVLTKQGWIRVDTVSNDKEIAVFDKNSNTIKFEIPSKWLRESYSGDMHSYEGKSINTLVTPNHKILFEQNNKFTTKESKEIFKNYLSCLRIPVSGTLNNNSELNLSKDEIKLLVAIQADGNIRKEVDDPTSVRFGLRKIRKINRLVSILNSLNLPYSRTDDSEATRITVFGVEKFIKMLGKNKEYGYWLLDMSIEQRKLFIDELQYWDGLNNGYKKFGVNQYFTSNKNNAEWVATICNLTGLKSTICNRLIAENENESYIVSYNSTKFANVSKRKLKKYEGIVYCPTTSTGYFMIRRDGKISITGNSNYGITPNMFVLNTLEKSAGKIVLKKRDAEFFLEMYHSLFPEIREWHREVERQVQETRMLFNLLGDPITFTNSLDKEKDIKEAYSAVPQSTVGCITNEAIVQTQNYIEDSGVDWDILANTHDSFLVQHKPEDWEICQKIMKAFIEPELTSPRGEKFNMRSEGASGYNWSPFHPDKNPDGLKEVDI